MTSPHQLYSELAHYWPLLSPPESLQEEAQKCLALLTEKTGFINNILELGCGSGSLASHFPEPLQATLVDHSSEMLALSQARNPQHTHHCLDVRDFKLNFIFDAVLMHDAVMYLTSPTDLLATLKTAAHHVRPGGTVLFIPDVVTETFSPGHTLVGGFDTETCSGRLTEWHHSADPSKNNYKVEFSLMIMEKNAPVRCIHETHTMGLFSFDEWNALLQAAGFVLAPPHFDVNGPAGIPFRAYRPTE